MLVLPPLSLYIHYPWCVKKCPYCDFNSHENGSKSGYIKELLNDLDADLSYIQGRSIRSIFIGGWHPKLNVRARFIHVVFWFKTKTQF